MKREGTSLGTVVLAGLTLLVLVLWMPGTVRAAYDRGGFPMKQHPAEGVIPVARSPGGPPELRATPNSS